MITRALLEGIKQETLPREAYTVPVDDDGEPQPTPEFLEAFVEQTDSSVIEKLRTADEGSPARDLIDRLCERRLLRQTETVALHRDHEQLDHVRLSVLLDPEEFTKEDTDAIEQSIVEDLGIEPHLVAIYIDRWSNPTYVRPGGAGKGTSRIQFVDGTRKTYLYKQSEIFNQDLGADQAYLHLYMPELKPEQERRAKELLWQALKND